MPSPRAIQSAAQNRATAATAAGDSSRTRWPASGNVATVAFGSRAAHAGAERRGQQAILLAPHDQARHVDPAEPTRHDAVERVVPQHQGGRAHLPVAVDGEVDVVGILGQVRLHRLEAVDEPPDQLLGRDAEQVVDLARPARASPVGATSTRRRRRCFCSIAKRAATSPPSENPTRLTSLVRPSWSNRSV